MSTPPPDRESAPFHPENDALDELIAILDLDPVGEGTFRGDSPKDRWQRVFGGQVLGQALVAAQRTVEARVCHSLHGYFLRAGDPKTPIV
ncbi:MAG: acyl-CoA thioesterase [Pseudomonadota bacterium]|jgi:acyl-CoA thioesterase-2